MIETQSEFILKRIASLLLYESVFNNEVGEAFLKILETLDKGDRDPNAIGVDVRQTQKCYARDCLQAYGNWFKVLAAHDRSWQDREDWLRQDWQHREGWLRQDRRRWQQYEG